MYSSKGEGGAWEEVYQRYKTVWLSVSSTLSFIISTCYTYQVTTLTISHFTTISNEGRRKSGGVELDWQYRTEELISEVRCGCTDSTNIYNGDKWQRDSDKGQGQSQRCVGLCVAGHFVLSLECRSGVRVICYCLYVGHWDLRLYLTTQLQSRWRTPLLLWI